MQSSEVTDYRQASSPFQDIPVLQSVLDNAVDGLIVLSAERNVVYLNHAASRMIGDDAIGIHCGTLLHCHDADHSSLRFDGCYGQCVLASGRPFTNIEMNIKNIDGETVPVEVTYSYIPVPKRSPYLLMSLRDITDKKQAERARRQKEELRYTLQERERLARDLHDGVVQDIAFVNMQVKLLLEDLESNRPVSTEQLTKISQVLDNGYGELRTAIRDLSLGISGNLKHHLSQSVLEFQTRTNIDVVLDCDPLPTDLEISFVHQVTKIVQEALTNIRKHAEATNVQIAVKRSTDNHTLHLDVMDNGIGFVTGESQPSGHYGMKTMCERCELLGGNMTVRSRLHEGTHIHCDIPLG